MPEELVEKLNSKMSDKLQDYSDNLVGKVSEELAFDEEIVKIAQEGLGQFIGKYQAYTELRNSFGARLILTTTTTDYKLFQAGLYASLKTNTILFTYIQALVYRVCT